MLIHWLFLQSLGCLVQSSLIDEPHNPVSFVEYKNDWLLPSYLPPAEMAYKRNKRLISNRPEEGLPASLKVVDVSPETAHIVKKKGSRNSKKKNGSGKDDPFMPSRVAISNKKLKKQLKMKKTSPTSLRQGQSPKRLRQHMQHKKKVQQLIQKRIQEQIEQRNPNPSMSI